VGLSKICKETLQNAEETLTKMVDEKGNEAPFENPSENE
jgi:exodeoxyribonuclease VII small subunit